MNSRTNRRGIVVAILGVLAVAYFVSFPDDLFIILGLLGKVLAVSNQASPWLYAVIAVAILSWTAVRIWGGERANAANGMSRPPDR